MYAPDLNPQEGICTLVERGLGNLAGANTGHLAGAATQRLRTLRSRSHLIDGCLSPTG
ncbi:hypothetical protein GCM10010442_33390 [Kitasatospora kifunensis]